MFILVYFFYTIEYVSKSRIYLSIKTKLRSISSNFFPIKNRMRTIFCFFFMIFKNDKIVFSYKTFKVNTDEKGTVAFSSFPLKNLLFKNLSDKLTYIIL